MDKTNTDLDDLRREIDEIDESIHDLLMRRTDVARRIGGIKGTGPSLRPAREAVVLRRLVARHAGPFPKTQLVGIWREIMAANLRLQGPFTVAVFAPDENPGYWRLARDQYGSHTPMMYCQSPGQVMREVAEDRAAVGILPYPEEEEEEPWWPLLLGPGKDNPQVIARLPFADERDRRGAGLHALAVAKLTPEATGDDRSLLAFETGDEISRARLHSDLAAAELPARFMAIFRGKRRRTAWQHLIEVDGLVLASDERVGRFRDLLGDAAGQVLSLGAYATPLTAEDLGPGDGAGGGAGT
ncbi:MAG: chorismate mutase [Proteobacteria bacterium]|nr:chorismate mutase [Pseudomonadota bacterium]MCH8095894.1 chorismate mutase [Pseudomonadota bacterium]